jgi:hypothetical protein
MNVKQRKSIVKVFQIILFTELTLQIDIKYNLLFNKQKEMKFIVDKLIDNVIDHRSRFEGYISKQSNNGNINNIHNAVNNEIKVFTKRKTSKPTQNTSFIDQNGKRCVRVSDERDSISIENTDSSVSFASRMKSILNKKMFK